MAVDMSGVFLQPPPIRFESGSPFLDAYIKTDTMLRGQEENQRDRERASRLMWEFEQLRKKTLQADEIDAAQRAAFGASGMPSPMPQMSTSGPAMIPMPDRPAPPSPSYTTAPVPDRTIDPSFDPVRFQERLIAMESGGNPTARNPRSSATGLGQFIDSTWLAVAPVVARRLGQDLTGMPREQVLALRNDPEWSKAAIQVYAEQNQTQMERALGHKVGEGHLGLAHGFGAQGAVGVLQADPATVADQHFPPKVIDANPHLRGKTLADIMRQYGITVPNAPGANPEVMGRVATPEQQAAMAPVRNSPAGRALETHDWRRETTAQPVGGVEGIAQRRGLTLANATGANPGQAMGTETGIDGLFQRYTNPAMQDYRRRLAGIPGAGAELMKSHAGEWTARDEMGLKAFEAASKGMPDAARYFAQQAGLRVDPRIFENRDMSARAFDVLKSMAGQDPAYVAGVMKGVLQGQPMAQAWAAAGTPQPKPASEIGRLAADFGISPTSPEGQALGRRALDGKLKGDSGGFKNENQLRDEYTKLTKEFRTVQSAYDKIKANAASMSGAGDMAMLYSFVKLLDPESVVRESEFAAAAASGSFGERVQGAVTRLATGERLPDSLRNDFLREADNIYKAELRGYERNRTNYDRLATTYGLDPKNVLLDFAAPAQPKMKNGLPQFDRPDDPALQALPPGSEFFDANGVKRRKP